MRAGTSLGIIDKSRWIGSGIKQNLGLGLAP